MSHVIFLLFLKIRNVLSCCHNVYLKLPIGDSNIYYAFIE
nr:MAG TPA: hypothetical protein [Myoviridae sp. ctNPX13]DAM47439.1 MAG TPA: hypothetical protein [Caudoviricetes sp.]